MRVVRVSCLNNEETAMLSMKTFGGKTDFSQSGWDVLFWTTYVL
jgi:hypothetical protein